MVRKKSESDFRNWFRDRWEGWIETYEPRHGSGVGIADIQIVCHNKLVPIELKVGTIDNQIVRPEKFRGVQIGWHRRLNDAGVPSGFLVGCPTDLVRGNSDRFLAFWVDPWDAVDWLAGFEIGIKARPVKDINKDIPCLVQNFLLRSR